MNQKNRMKFTIMVFFVFLLLSCGGNTNNNLVDTPILTSTPESDIYDYIATISSYDISISGNEFQIETDNCGADVSTKETLSRSRSFEIKLEVDLTTSLGAEFKGDVLVAGAKIQTAIENTLGIQVGTIETAYGDREIETPANSISITTLQWEEFWDTGNVNIVNDLEKTIAQIPFRILTTLRLSQKAVDVIPCTDAIGSTNSTNGTSTTEVVIQNPPTNTSIPPSPTPLLVPPTHTIVPTRTPTPIPGGVNTGIDNGDLTVLLSSYEFRSDNHPENAPVKFLLTFINNTDQAIPVQINLLAISAIDNIGTVYGEYYSAGARYCDNSPVGCVFGPNQPEIVEQLEKTEFTVNANNTSFIEVYLTVEGVYYDQKIRVDLQTDWIDVTVPIIQYRSDSFKQIGGKWRLMR